MTDGPYWITLNGGQTWRPVTKAEYVALETLALRRLFEVDDHSGNPRAAGFTAHGGRVAGRTWNPSGQFTATIKVEAE